MLKISDYFLTHLGRRSSLLIQTDNDRFQLVSDLAFSISVKTGNSVTFMLHNRSGQLASFTFKVPKEVKDEYITCTVGPYMNSKYYTLTLNQTLINTDTVYLCLPVLVVTTVSV